MVIESTNILVECTLTVCIIQGNLFYEVIAAWRLMHLATLATCSHYRYSTAQLHGDVCTSMGCFVRQPGIRSSPESLFQDKQM